MPDNKYSISADGSVSISFSKNVDRETLEEQLPSLLKLLSLSLEANSIDPAIPLNRICAIEALKTLYEFHLYKAESVLEAIPALAAGEISARQIGFPEFDDDAPEGQFD